MELTIYVDLKFKSGFTIIVFCYQQIYCLKLAYIASALKKKSTLENIKLLFYSYIFTFNI